MGSSYISDSQAGALFTFSPAPGGQTTTILVRAGVSFISTAQACSNAQAEINDFGFDIVHTQNRAQWNDLLGRIQVDTTNVPLETVQLFYSSVLVFFLPFLVTTEMMSSSIEHIYHQLIVSGCSLSTDDLT